MNIGNELLKFIEKSPTCFQAADTACEMLQQQGYQLLQESEPWDLVPGGRYAVMRNHSSLIAFSLPEGPITGFMIGAAHSDSPTFRVKPLPELAADGHYVKLNTEPYGGGIYSTWLDRPLSVAGRITVETPHGLKARLVRVDRDLFVIPQVAIHMNRKANEGTAFNAHSDMMPLFSSEAGAGSFLDVIAEAAGVQKEDILGTDLFLYNRTPGMLWGKEEEYVSAPRLDDLQCAFALLRGFMAAAPSVSAVPVYALFDNEEVGSLSLQGADSTFLSDVLTRIAGALSQDSSHQDYLRLLAGSFLVSADNAHAVHPNHPEYADPANRVYMNHGIVIKFNGNLKYTSDGVSSALFRKLCRLENVSSQVYTNRSDLPGGSTLGNLSNRHVSLRAVDIGLAQLAMHSAYETAGVKDTEDLIRVMTRFYGSSLRTDAAGDIILE
ncbi:MAG: M18 family aminopeptidase [Lachnospiraceae bacterium]|nr:M18 family aminopeptidase [Lachnospiraceae bacterium]